LLLAIILTIVRNTIIVYISIACGIVIAML